jgi:hypothetical protein
MGNTEYDANRCLETANKIQRELNKTETDKIQLNPICKDERNTYFKDLWTINEEEETITNGNTDPKTVKELKEAIKIVRIISSGKN